MNWFKRKEKVRYFHVVFSATFGKGTRFVSATMSVKGNGIIQSHILEIWRQSIMQDGDCTNAIILNFVEVDNA